MRSRFLLLTCLLLTTRVFAQDNMPYADKAAQLQKEVWGTEEPEFKATTVPENLKNESAVILARSFNSQRSSTGKVKYMIITAGITSHTVKINTFHERVKINDKAALENFSQLQYQKILDKTVNLLITKFTDTHNTYIGAKIIKPDGKEVIVNTSEEVLTKNETRDKQGKLAISNLQAGDILDYYISTVEVSEKADADSYSDNDKVILLADEYPVIYFNINFQFSKKVHVNFINANDAPAFEESTNDAGDYVLNLVARDLPKFQSQLWTSPLRQYPYVEVGSSFNGNIFDSSSKKMDQLTPLERSKTQYENSFVEYQDFDIPEKKLKNYFISNRALKEAPVDSVMKVLYDEWKFLTFFNYSGKELDDVDAMNYRRANSQVATMIMSEILTDMEIDHDVLLVASRNSNSLDNVFNKIDFETMIRINGDTPMYMAFDDIVTHFNEIPARFQGEKVTIIHGKRKSPTKYVFTDYGDDQLAATPSDKNYLEENLQVSLLPSNMQKLKIDRTVKETGNLRHDDQKLLIPVQDMDKGYMSLVNGDPLEKRLSHVRETKKMAADYIFTFNKEHDEISKNFTTEIKGSFDQDPEQVANYKIINYGLENSTPVFEFSSSFVLNNLVKKAGNNYIIDAGKLTGAFLKLDDKDKVRDKDIYMPSSRSFKYTIAIAIPPGYTAKGLEEMNHKKVNATGSFTSVAAVSGNTLTITVTRVYTNNFEKAEDWPKLKELIQTASDFNDQKILLEKKG